MKTQQSITLNLSKKKKISDIGGINNNLPIKYLKLRHFKLIKNIEKVILAGKSDEKIYKVFQSKLKNYKYFRNITGYPSRGQRTHTNGKTKRKIFKKNIL